MVGDFILKKTEANTENEHRRRVEEDRKEVAVLEFPTMTDQSSSHRDKNYSTPDNVMYYRYTLRKM